MYFFKMMIVLFFSSGLQVNSQFAPVEVTGSGDGINENSSYSRLPLIDDNGDISTAVTNVDVINSQEIVDNFTDTTLLSTDSIVEETTIKFLVNDTFTDPTMSQNSRTTISTTVVSATDQETTDTPIDSTTTSLLITSSTTETTTTIGTTTEEDSKITETTRNVKTTKKPIKTDTATEAAEVEHNTTPKDTTATKIPSTSASASTVSVAKDAGKRCLFIDTGLTCDTEVICYGDGEIDCTDDEEMDADETDFADDIPSAIDDGISEGEVQHPSGTLPWRWLGSNSQKIDLFKMFPLTPTNNDVSSEKNEDMTTTSMPSSNFTPPLDEELLSEETVAINSTIGVNDAENIQDSEVIKELDVFLPSTESTNVLKEHDDEKLSGSNDNSSNIEFIEGLDDMFLGSDEALSSNFSIPLEFQVQSNISETIIYEEGINNDTSSEVTSTIIDLTTSNALDKILENITEKENVNQGGVARLKRDNSANSSNGYYISNYKVSELESSEKKINMKSCKLSGNLVCIPRPTKSSCSGKTLCQVPPQAIETVEKPAKQKGLEKWTIAVIVICAITAAFTIALLIYLVFTSYKKLKVQPQNGVTTLNYINSTQP